MSQNPMGILADRVDRIACGKCGQILDVSELDSFSVINCPHCGTEQKVPAVLGAFLLAEQMGAGGMGAVYRAVDQALGRFVAIKVMKQEMGADRELVESFLREARAAAALNHPNIVQIYSCGQEKGQPYIVMELVGGGRLDQMMEDGKKVDEVRLLQVALDVAEGLKAANGANLVHGDIKPANILFDQKGTAKVVDFGLAQFVNRQQEQGGIWGTPYYISPERARGGKADHRSDIYSLGATMYHALTGLPPFDGKTATDVVVARLKAPPVKIQDLVPSLQPQTAALIERMMASDPVLRYPTSASLLADMKTALTAAKEANSPSGRAKKHQKRDWGHWIIGGMAGLIMLILVVVLVRMAKKTESRPAGGSTNQVAAVTNAFSAGDTTNAAPEAAAGEVQFFNPEADAALAQTLGAMDADKPLPTAEALQALMAKVPRNSARMMWLQVLQAVPYGLAGQVDQVDQGLRATAASPINQKRGHALYMPQNLALLLIGDMKADRFAREAADWPAWYGDLSAGLLGFKNMQQGDLAGAATEFDRYLTSSNSLPAWAFALRPVSRVWRGKLDGWEGERKRLVDLAASGDLDGARAGAEKAQADAPVFTKGAWATVYAEIKKVEQQRAAEAAAAAEAKRQVVVREEIARVSEFMGTNTQYTGAAKDYRKLNPLLLKLKDEFQTPEGRAQVDLMREHLDRLESLKALLIKEMGASPYRGTGAEAGWEAVGANVLGVRISQAGRVTQLRPWDQLSPRFMVRLLRHYIEQSGRSAAEQADLNLSLALFCHYNAPIADEPAGKYVKLAQDQDATSAAKARRLLPDVTLE
jgi:hypothetical protein